MNAALDANGRQTILTRLDTNQLVIQRVTANPVTGAMKVNDGTTGTAPTDNWTDTDDNGRWTWTAVSSTDSNVLVALQADSTGALLIDSN